MSEILKFNLNESIEFSFQLDIEGALATINSVRFVIIKNDLRLGFVADYKDKNAIFRFTNLGRFLDAGIYPCELEVYIGSQYFVPFQGQVELTKPITISATPMIAKSVPKITVSLERDKIVKSEEVAEKVPTEQVEKVEKIEKAETEPIKKSKKKTAYVLKL